MRKNLLLISLDTVRADVGYSGSFRTIERLRKQGVSFLNTVSSSPLTPVSHATVFTGLQPSHHGVRHLFREQLPKRVSTLAQYFKQNGYTTGAVVSCPGMNKWYGFSRGFQFYDDEIPRLADGTDPLQTVDVKKRGTALKRAEVCIGRAEQWLESHGDQNFFLFVHLFDAHWPYQAPKIFGGKNPYEHEVAYADHFLGTLFDRLERMKLLQDTSIVCFSDHGEDLEGWYPNDKGGRKLGHPEECGHGCLLYDQTQKVLMIIKDKAFPAHRNIQQQVRLVDLMPTILDLFSFKKKGRPLDGVSLVPLVKNNKRLNLLGYSETFYPEEQTLATHGKYSYAKNKIAFRIDNTFKLINHLGSDEQEFYDLQQDPNELSKLP